MSEASATRDPAELEAWREFCRRIEALGERVLSDEFPRGEHEGPEGIAHLADQVACWLTWVTGHSDPSAPFFHRSNDLVTQWGGPNQDNSYHHTRIDPQRRYRIRGEMHSCEDFALTLRAGFMHMEVWGTKASLSAKDRGIGPGDSFEILLGGDGSDPDWLPIPDEVTTLSLREYYVDWQAAEPAVFAIECLDEVPAPERLNGPAVAEKLEHALDQIESSMDYWNRYLADNREKGRDNEFALPLKLAKGLPDARYAFCFWNLAPDEALYIESDVPEARYWGLQLATMGNFEPVDAIHRISSINQHQAHIDADGRLRLLLSHEDVGAPNWLDSEGRRSGLMTFRWFWPQSDPHPQTRVVKTREAPALFPDAAAMRSPEERRAEIRKRKEHLAWRFRT